MREDFVSFDLAKKLKEKGFPQNTIGVCEAIGATYFCDGRFYENGCIADVDECYSAPTIYQALKWLRDSQEIHLVISLGLYGWYFEAFSYECYKGEVNEYVVKEECVSVYYDSYEDATIGGIKFVLNNLI